MKVPRVARLALWLSAAGHARAGAPLWVQEPGETSGLAGERIRIRAVAELSAPLVREWYHEGVRLTGADAEILTLSLDPARAGNWQAVARSAAGEAWSSPAAVGVVWPAPVPGVVDGGFVTRLPWRARFHALAALAYAGGYRLAAGGEVAATDTGATLSGCLTFLRPDGSVDPSAGAALPNGIVRALAMTADGRMMAAGDFTSWDGQARGRLAMVSAVNGALLEPGSGRVTPTADGAVHCLLPLPDGRLVIGGEFTKVNDVPRAWLARLLPDGTVDPAFNPPAGLNGPVRALLGAGGGTMVIGGSFTGLGAAGAISRIARLHENGALDAAWGAAGGATGDVLTLSRQEASREQGLEAPRIVAGGAFLRMHGQLRQRLARLKEDGTLDGAFRADADAPVRALLPESPGGLVVAGDFLFLKGRSCAGLARLAPNLSGGVVFEGTFRPPALDASVRAVFDAGSGGFVAAGDFTMPRESVMRVWSTIPPAEPPQILALPPVAAPVAGGPLRVTATVRGYPAPALRWKRGTQIVSEAGPVLRLDRVSAADAGTWTLEAANASGTVTRDFVIQVRPAPWPGESQRRAWTREGLLVIPDGGTAEASLTVPAGESLTIHRLRAAVDLRHVETGDLTVTLIAPGGTAVALMTPLRRTGWDLAGTVFDDAAAMTLTETADPHPGACRPAEPLTAAFRGMAAGGVWRLRVEDRLPDNVSGTLLRWTLEADGPPVTPSFAAWAAANGYASAVSEPLWRKYAFGDGTNGTPAILTAGGNMEIQMERPFGAVDMEWSCERSSDLSGWGPYGLTGPEVTAFATRFPNGREHMRYRMPAPAPPEPARRYFRFKARRL